MSVSIPKKVCERMTLGMKRLGPILQQQRARDVSEADTVTLVKDLLAEVFGYDKYAELTGELAIRGTYCDLAIKLDDKFVQLIEVKAIGIELNDRHVKQAIDYAANEGISWVVLTSGSIWRLYCVRFSKPIEKTLVFEIDVINCNCKDDDVVECFGNLSSEGYSKDSLADLLSTKQTSSKFTIAAVLRSEAMVESLRKEIRRLSGVRLEPDFLVATLENEIIKRELIDGDQGTEAVSYVKKLRRGYEKEKSADGSQPAAGVVA